jgi:phage-related protein (TIGR01555 family)
VLEAFWEALCYRRAYGGSAILLGANDGIPDITQPLDEERITSIDFLNPMTGGWDGEIVAWSYYRDPTKPNYGMPEIYMVRNIGVPIANIPAPTSTVVPPDPVLPSLTSPNTMGYGQTVFWIHESRLLIFPGTAVSHWARVQMRGWGDSLFMRIDRVLQQFDQTWGGISSLMTEFSQGVLKIDGLAQMMGANNKAGVATLSQRALALQMSRSISRLLLIDGEEEFSRDSASLGGVADVLTQFGHRLAAAADMPVDLLFGQMIGGSLNKGDTSYRFFADRISAKQKKEMLPQLRRLVRLLFRSKKGPTKGKEPKKWSIAFRSLYQLTEVEKADVRLKTTQADQIVISTQQATPEEVAATRYGGSEYNTGNIVLDYEGRREMADQDAKDMEEKKRALLEAAKNPPAPPPPAPVTAQPAPAKEPPTKAK